MGISREQALDCFRSDDLIGIGMEADAVRRRLHPEGVVSYGIEAAISCAGRDFDEIFAEMEEAEETGATAVILSECVDLGLDGLEPLIAGMKQRFPEMRLQGFSAAELLALASPSSLDEVLARLRDAGLDSIGATKPEVPGEDWLKVHRAAHRAGLRTTARVVFGAGETLEQRLDGLEAVRSLQEETGGFAAFVPVSFHAINGRELDETTAVEYLKTLAVSRMVLDNIENMQSDWTTQGRKVLQMGLRFGGNDVGSAGAGATEEELRRMIRDAGFRPAQRDMLYQSMFLD